MRKLGIVALGAAAALTLAGCASGGSGASEEGAEIRVWLVGTDTPDEAREYLMDTFEKENPGSTLVIEEQSWDGLVDRLTTSLSGSDSPDVVEVGNTQASAFTSAGAFLDLTEDYETLGGDDLLPGFVEAGSYDGKFYAAPLLLGRSPRLLQEGRPRGGRTRRFRRRSTSTSRTARRSRPRTPASRASGGPARTGTTPFPTSGRTAARSPSPTVRSGTRSSRAPSRSPVSRRSRRS